MYLIDYKDYLDKVFGCWIGKCVAGTIGAPYEGMKELMSFEYDPVLIKETLPNDDLDLQVLWLDVLEEKGIWFTSDDLAEAFISKCPYAPGEYAIFKKNYMRGIHPPVCGGFNNRYYIEGMGCPIRSEIWACIAPGNPELAAQISAKDGVLDHAGNSVYAEQFLAGLEAAAFFESDPDKLVEIGLGLIPAECKVAGLIRDVREWCRSSGDWKYVRGKIIRNYGHPDCTNMFQNIGITLMAFYLGKMDLIKSTMMALNCGFDTDCTCATVGAIIGIIQGADYLMKKHDLKDPGYVLEVKVTRRSDRILDLAEDTCMMGLHFAKHLNTKTAIENAPEPPSIVQPAKDPVTVSVDYNGAPAVGIGDSRRVGIVFTSNSSEIISGKASLDVPEGLIVDAASNDIALSPGQHVRWDVNITVPEDIPALNEKNIFTVSFTASNDGVVKYDFGLAGAAVWQVFGPFWQNNVEMPQLKLKESYYGHIPGKDKNDYADQVRTYHLNTRVDIEREYMTPDSLSLAALKCDGDACKEASVFNSYEDLFSVNDVVGFQGPCAVYMVRRLISPEDRTLCLQIGHTDAYQLWINGNLISERNSVDWWTGENAHLHDISLVKGPNTIVVKLIRRGAKADFSLVFSKGATCAEHFCDFASVNPNADKM